jgi:hypothetical protein
MMISKFYGPVKTEGAVAVACSDLLANQPSPRRGNDARNWLGVRFISRFFSSAGGGK